MNFKEEYPALQNCTYLDTASSGIISKETLKWRNQHDLAFLNKGSFFRKNQAIFLDEVRDELTKFFKANREYCFLVPNFSFGFNSFLNGLKPETKFLLLEDDYPSVNQAVRIHLFKNESIAITSDLEEKLIEKINEGKPDVFACSLVQYLDGYRIDLNLLKRIKEKFPNLLIAVDGTQYCGTADLDFEGSGIDFFGASGYKWMLAGYGNGFVFLSGLAASKVYEQAKNLPAPTEPFLRETSFLGSFFEPGHLDTLNFGTLKQAILERKNIGNEYIKTKLNQLGQLATKEFEKRNVLTKPLLQRDSTQYFFNLILSESILESLTEKQVIFTRRGRGIRVGFHLYNEIADLEKLLAVIDGEK